MALTAEQQSQLELQNAMEATRHANQLVVLAAQSKLECVRLAQQTLVENARSKPVDERDITATDITTFANTLASYTSA
tara:strand:- start:314 stop:547 length:234 start_codon:yes stop_codon:yes gene_type:complete